MKQKTLIYMVIKPSIVLAAAVLTAASFLAPSTATAADPTYLMPTGPGGGQPDDHIQPFDPLSPRRVNTTFPTVRQCVSTR
jgi:hypothetical protein